MDLSAYTQTKAKQHWHQTVLTDHYFVPQLLPVAAVNKSHHACTTSSSCQLFVHAGYLQLCSMHCQTAGLIFAVLCNLCQVLS